MVGEIYSPLFYFFNIFDLVISKKSYIFAEKFNKKEGIWSIPPTAKVVGFLATVS